MNDEKIVSDGSQPLVTVAIPVFNGGFWLELAVFSVLNQTWKHWELLILDDASTDDGIERLKIFSDPRIKLISDGENRGLPSRINQAVSIANGKYLARMDQDDICHPERLAKQVAFLENNPSIDLLATKCVTIDNEDCVNGMLPFVRDDAAICRRPWQGFYMPHPTWMGRTEWFRRNPYQDPGPFCCEDQELLLRAHISSCYHALSEPLLAYRVRSHTRFVKLWNTRIAMMKMKAKYFLSLQQWSNLLLACFVEVVRIVYDCWGELRYRLGFPLKCRFEVAISNPELQNWAKVINSIKSTGSFLVQKK